MNFNVALEILFLINSHVSQISKLREEKKVTRDKQRERNVGDRKCERERVGDKRVCACVRVRK